MSDVNHVPASIEELAVDRFAEVMKSYLTEIRGSVAFRWDDPSQCSVETLAVLLTKHFESIQCQLTADDDIDPRFFEKIAVYAMMLNQRGASPSVMSFIRNDNLPSPVITFANPAKVTYNGRE